MLKAVLFTVFGMVMFSGCATAPGEGSSQPVNKQEVVDYKQALYRCYKTGGSRIVKINGLLQCY